MLGSIIFNLYRFDHRLLRYSLRRLATHLEKGEYYSPTLRRIFKKYYGVEIGLYTHGGCFIPGECDRFTTIGRYCSIARGVRMLNHNHPLSFKSTHAFFFNSDLKRCKPRLMLSWSAILPASSDSDSRTMSSRNCWPPDGGRNPLRNWIHWSSASLCMPFCPRAWLNKQ